MATFLERIENLVGSTTGIVSTALVTQHLSDAAKEIINMIPEGELYILAGSSADSGSGASIAGARFLYADKSGRVAREFSAALKVSLTDADSIHKATDFTPAFYRQGNTVFVVGTTAGGTVWKVTYPTVAYSDSSITNFPVELEQLVALRAAITCRQAQLAYFRTNSFPSAPSVSPLVIGVSAPTAPSAPSISYSDALAADFSQSAAWGSLPTAPTFTPAVSLPDYTALDSAYTLEDVELAGVQLQKIAAKLNEYQANIQQSVNAFNKELAVYQSDVQKRQTENQNEQQRLVDVFGKTTDLNLQNEIQTLSAAVQQYSATLSKYQAEVQSYQAQVSKEVAQYSNSLQGTIEAFTASLNMAQQKYAGMVQELANLQGQYTFGLSAYVTKGMPGGNSNGK